MEEINNVFDPNYVPDELKVPYDIIELPSQGILYENKKSKVKLEYLTAMDENVLSSPNISNSDSVLDILLNRKVKDLGFDPLDLIIGDRMSLLIYLRVTGFGEKYPQSVWDVKNNKMVEGEIDLSKLEQKKLTVSPDENGHFDYELPISKQKIKFKLLTARDDKTIEERNKRMQERVKDNNISFIPTLRLEQLIHSIDGEKDKLKMSQTIARMKIMDIRKLNKYVSDIEPGVNFKTKVLIAGGESIDGFLRFTTSFFFPEL